MIGDINNNYETRIGIPIGQLKELKKEYLLDLILFINYCCNLTLEDNRFIDSTYSIFKIEKKINRYKCNIVIDSNYNNDQKIIYDNNNISKDNKKEEFREVFNLGINNQNQINGIKINNENKNIINNEAPPLINNINKKNNIEKNIIKIKCKECDLTFDKVEKMNEHYFEIHEKNKKEKKENEYEFKTINEEKNEKINKKEVLKNNNENKGNFNLNNKENIKKKERKI